MNFSNGRISIQTWKTSILYLPLSGRYNSHVTSEFHKRMLIRFIAFAHMILLISGNQHKVSGQQFQNLQQAEDTLRTILSSINLASDDSMKAIFNQKYSATLLAALQLPSADTYPFDSLKTMVKLTAPDNKFRVFQWNLPTADRMNHYYGFIKMLNREPPLIYPLVDKSDSIPSPETSVLNNKEWFGALYYKVVPVTTSTGSTVYTLLGWAGKNALITQKVIEILSFDENDQPHFGLRIFPEFEGGNNTRIIFRFSASTSMSLKYEKQIISSKKYWNSKKKVFEYSQDETQMIICDRMEPPDSRMVGLYQFYHAAGDIYDGFVFKHHAWTYIVGIDARNK